MPVYDVLEAIVAEKRWEDLRPLLLAAPGQRQRQRGAAGTGPAARTGTGSTTRRLGPARRTKRPGRHGGCWRSGSSSRFGRRRSFRAGPVAWAGSPADALMAELAIARGAEFCSAVPATRSPPAGYAKDDNPQPDARLTTLMVAPVTRLSPPVRSSDGPPGAQPPLGPGPGCVVHPPARGEQPGRTGPGPPPYYKTLADSLRGRPDPGRRTPSSYRQPERASGVRDARRGRFVGARPGRRCPSARAALDQARVLRDVLEALTRLDTAHTQRALAKPLTALEPSTPEVAGRMPRCRTCSPPREGR